MSRILVIEDDKHIRSAIVDTLASVGYEMQSAEDGFVGVHKARVFKPDLVLCDIMMPEMDGYAVLFQLQKSPETSVIPVIFLTALSSYDDIRKGMSMGADDYLIKPFTGQELIDTVRTRLERRKRIENHSAQQMESIREYINLTLPHELRTPLTGMLGYLYMLRDSYEQMDREGMEEMLTGLEKSVDRLRILIENFTAYSQLHMILGDQDLITRLHQYSIMRDFNEKVMHQTEQEAFLFGRYNDIKMQIDPADLLLYTDHATKLISCLVSNACKFSDKGTPITVIGRAMPDHYCLKITNSGRGMTPEQIASISINRQFERNIYEQQGAGLGLVIAKQIVHLYNGTMHIESIPGKETTVTLMLRYARQHLAEQAV